MNVSYNRLALVFCVLYFACTSSRLSTRPPDTMPASAMHPFGRTVLNKAGHMDLVSSAVHFGFSFEGTECKIVVSLPNAQSHNYLQYELDGRYEKRVRISGDSAQAVVLKAQQGGRHAIWIYKATEAHTGAITIQAITGKKITPLQRPPAPLIEFIGNSITCGAAADASEVPCGTGVYHDQNNAYNAYGPRVARMLGANFIVSGVSGIGVYRNWNSDGPTMPQVYEKTDFQSANPHNWNFDRYSPRVVSIALGTNDFSNGDGKQKRDMLDSSRFVNNYIAFIKQVKSKYPKAQLALLSSPMLNGTSRILLQNCLTSVKNKIDSLEATASPVALYFFEPMQPHGCTGHPSVDDHALLANELEPFFKKLLTGQ